MLHFVDRQFFKKKTRVELMRDGVEIDKLSIGMNSVCVVKTSVQAYCLQFS
jgi:hypothetical protein